jgi:hypothetical protein
LGAYDIRVKYQMAFLARVVLAQPRQPFKGFE